jgi:hypothetical protein
MAPCATTGVPAAHCRDRPAVRRLPRHVKTCIAAGHPRHIRFAKSLIRDQTIAVSLTGET